MDYIRLAAPLAWVGSIFTGGGAENARRDALKFIFAAEIMVLGIWKAKQLAWIKNNGCDSNWIDRQIPAI